MSNWSKKQLLFTFLFILTSPLSSWAESKPCPISMGLILPLTGPASSFGKQMKAAAEMSWRDLPETEREGFSLLFEDSEMKAISGLNAFNKFVSLNHIDVGMAFGAEAVGAIVPIAERLKVPTFVITPNRAQTKDMNFSFRHWIDSESQAPVLVSALEQRSLRHVALFYSEQSAMKDFAEKFRRVASEKNKKIVLEHAFLPTDADFRSAILKLANVEFDSVVFFMLPPQLSVFAKQYKALGNQQPLFSFINVESSNEVRASAGTMEGIVYTGPVYSDDFIRRFQEAVGVYPELASGNVYDEIQIVAAARRQGACTTTAVKQFVANLSNFKGVLGTYGVIGSNEFSFPVQLKVIKGNTFVKLTPDAVMPRLPR